eukprot:351903-Chlamydomonas_euryale.AAC.1
MPSAAATAGRQTVAFNQQRKTFPAPHGVARSHAPARFRLPCKRWAYADRGCQFTAQLCWCTPGMVLLTYSACKRLCACPNDISDREA